MFAAAGSAYVLGYGLLAVEQHGWPVLICAFLLAGIAIGFAETAESTLVAQMLPDRLRGNGFGFLGLVQSLGDLASSVVVGVLWGRLLGSGGLRVRRGLDARLRRLLPTTAAPHGPCSLSVEEPRMS